MSTLVQWELVAETIEWVGPIDVAVNGSPVGVFRISVCADQARPTTWTTPDLDPNPPGTEHGVIVGTGTPWPILKGKRYTIFIQFTDAPEQPVLRAGLIKVT
jgi:hypothetical protein